MSVTLSVKLAPRHLLSLLTKEMMVSVIMMDVHCSDDPAWLWWDWYANLWIKWALRFFFFFFRFFEILTKFRFRRFLHSPPFFRAAHPSWIMKKQPSISYVSWHFRVQKVNMPCRVCFRIYDNEYFRLIIMRKCVAEWLMRWNIGEVCAECWCLLYLVSYMRP